MANPFFDRPILNSPYECPRRHWELDEQGQPTQKIIEDRRRAEFITPIPKPKKRKKSSAQQNDYGLESAKPNLQSTFKKPGGGVVRRAPRVRARTL